MISFVNGTNSVMVTSIALPIAHSYQQSTFIVSLCSLFFPFVYPIANFPCNWFLDNKGLKKGLLLAAFLQMLGSLIRCLVNYDFISILIGQFLCAISQPMILNATTKLAIRWFLPASVIFQ